MYSIQSCPKGVLANIFAFCDLKDLPSISLACKKFKEVLLENDPIWGKVAFRKIKITYQKGKAKEALISMALWKKKLANVTSKEQIKDIIGSKPFDNMQLPIQEKAIFIKAHECNLLKEILTILTPSYKLVTHSLAKSWDEEDVAEIIKKLDPSSPVTEKVIQKWESYAFLSPFSNLFNAALAQFKSDLGRHTAC